MKPVDHETLPQRCNYKLFISLRSDYKLLKYTNLSKNSQIYSSKTNRVIKPYINKRLLYMYYTIYEIHEIYICYIPVGQVKGDRYIFMYGGNDNKWIQEFKQAVDKIKRDEDTIKREDVIIDAYQLGKDDPKKISRFWMGIESKRQAKQFEKLDDEIQQVVKSLLCLKQDTQGWALLSKGSHVKVLGHGEPMYQTVANFDEWKKNVLEKESFDVAFKEYYDRIVKDLPAAPQPCAYMNIDNYPSNVIATITCPNASCGRVMEVTSVNYKCCHRDAPEGAKV